MPDDALRHDCSQDTNCPEEGTGRFTDRLDYISTEFIDPATFSGGVEWRNPNKLANHVSKLIEILAISIIEYVNGGGKLILVFRVTSRDAVQYCDTYSGQDSYLESCIPTLRPTRFVVGVPETIHRRSTLSWVANSTVFEEELAQM